MSYCWIDSADFASLIYIVSDARMTGLLNTRADIGDLLQLIVQDNGDHVSVSSITMSFGALNGAKGKATIIRKEGISPT